eukprot:403337824
MFHTSININQTSHRNKQVHNISKDLAQSSSTHQLSSTKLKQQKPKSGDQFLSKSQHPSTQKLLQNSQQKIGKTQNESLNGSIQLAQKVKSNHKIINLQEFINDKSAQSSLLNSPQQVKLLHQQKQQNFLSSLNASSKKDQFSSRDYNSLGNQAYNKDIQQYIQNLNSELIQLPQQVYIGMKANQNSDVSQPSFLKSENDHIRTNYSSFNNPIIAKNFNNLDFQLNSTLLNDDLDMKATVINQTTQKQYEYEIQSLKRKLEQQEKNFNQVIKSVLEQQQINEQGYAQNINHLEARLQNMEEIVAQFKIVKAQGDYQISLRSMKSQRNNNLQFNLTQNSRIEKQIEESEQNKHLITESNFFDDQEDIIFQGQLSRKQSQLNHVGFQFENQKLSQNYFSNQKSLTRKVQEQQNFSYIYSPKNISQIKSDRQLSSNKKVQIYRETSPLLDEPLGQDYITLSNINKDKLSLTSYHKKQESIEFENNPHRPSIGGPKFIKHIQQDMQVQNLNQLTYRSENVIETIRNSPRNKTDVQINFPRSNLCSPTTANNNDKNLRNLSFQSSPKVLNKNKNQNTNLTRTIPSKSQNPNLLLDLSSNVPIQNQDCSNKKQQQLHKKNSESEFEIEIPNEEFSEDIRQAINHQICLQHETQNNALITETRVQSSMSNAYGTNKPRNLNYVGVKSPLHDSDRVDQSRIQNN